MAANYREAANKKPGETATHRQLKNEIADTGTVSTSDAIVLPGASRKSFKE